MKTIRSKAYVIRPSINNPPIRSPNPTKNSTMATASPTFQ